MRFFLLDVKRIFTKKGTVILCLTLPMAVMLIFAAVAAPMLMTGKGLRYNIAIYNEDPSEPVREFISRLVNSEALRELVSVYPVQDAKTGRRLLEQDAVSVFLHIPPDLFKNIQAGEPSKIEIIGSKAHSLEMSLLKMTLYDSLVPVGKAENMLQEAVNILSDSMEPSEAGALLNDITNDAIREYMNRRLVLGDRRMLSPVSEYLPVEYYLGAVFSLFAALSMLPLIGFTARDVSGSVLRRGIAAGQGTSRFFCVRVCSGMLFILLVMLTLFPTAEILHAGSLLLGTSDSGNTFALISSILLGALCFSELAVCIGVWLPGEKSALWAGFYIAIGMAAASGALLPDVMLPEWISGAGRWMPMRALMRLISGAVFSYDPVQHTRDFLILGGSAVLLFPLGLLGFAKRGGAI
jgi:hypothetical protein